MLAAVNNFDSHTCLAHFCNNIVGKMLDIEAAKSIVTNASTLVKFVKRSQIGSQLSSKLQSLIETRWNTVYDMLMSIIANHQELYDLLKNNPRSNVLDKLTCLPMNEMKAICHLLEFFKNVTVAIEGDKFVTLHNYWLTLCETKRILAENRSDIDIVRAMKRVALDYIENAENSGSFRITLRHKLAVFLHPQMKGLSFAISRERREIHSHVRELLEKEHEYASQSSVQNESLPSMTSMSLFQGYFDDSAGDVGGGLVEMERYIASKIEVVIINWLI